MWSRVTRTTRRSRTSLDRDLSRRMRERRLSLFVRRRHETLVSELDVCVWLFGLVSLMACAAIVVTEVIGMVF